MGQATWTGRLLVDIPHTDLFMNASLSMTDDKVIYIFYCGIWAGALPDVAKQWHQTPATSESYCTSLYQHILTGVSGTI